MAKNDVRSVNILRMQKGAHLEIGTEIYYTGDRANASDPACTVQVAPACTGRGKVPQYTGIGWDHAGQDARIECESCADWLST